MAGWALVADVVCALLVLVALYFCWMLLRRRWIYRHGGTFELSIRVRPEKAGRGWVLGLGRYSGEELEWFRVFSVFPRPSRTWNRLSLQYEGRREVEGAEAYSLYHDHVIARCRTDAGEI